VVRPKKNLGQHFLTDPEIAGRIVDLLELHPNSHVLEIGPGKGILTAHLLEKNVASFQAVDIDKESVVHLSHEYPSHKESFLHEDFLNMDLGELVARSPATHLSVIGNFPYNISSQIFFKILDNRQYVDQVVCMIQKEVANRIASPPGSREYGILSVLLQAYFHLKLRFSVKPGSFFPPPKVMSGVVILKRNDTISLNCDEKLFFRVVKTCFNQRRKTIRNSIKSILLNLETDSGLLAKRPEQCSVNEFVVLTNLISKQLDKRHS